MITSAGLGVSSSTGSATATPLIRLSMSCSAAAIAAPPPFDTDEAITYVLLELYLTFEVPSENLSANCSLSTK